MDDKIKILEEKLEKATDYKEKIELLKALSDTFRKQDINQAISYIKTAISLSLIEKEENDFIDLQIHSIELFLHSKDYKEAFNALEGIQALSDEKKSEKQKARIYYCYGSVYMNLLEYEKAYLALKKSLEIYEKIKYVEGQITAIAGLAGVYNSLGEYKKSIEYYLSAISLTTNMETYSRLYNNIGNVYLDNNDLVHAKDYFIKALHLKKELGSIVHIPNTLINLINLSLSKGEIQQVNIYLNELTELSLKLNSAAVILEIKNVTIQLAIVENDLDRALMLLPELLELVERAEGKEKFKESYKLAVKIYKKTKDFEKALYFHEKLKELDTVENIADAKSKIEKISLSNEMEIIKKQNEIDHLKNVEIKTAYDEINSSLRYAKRIQYASMTEVSDFDDKRTAGFFYFEPKDIVGGDFFFTYTGESFSYFAVADCTGHGVPGALLSMLGSGLLRQIVLSNAGLSPNLILEKMHKQIQQSLKKDNGNAPADGMDMALIKIDFDKKRLEYSGANRPLLLFKKDEIIEIKADKNCLGGINTNETLTFTNHSFDIEKGNRVYLYSDGMVDQFGGEKKKKLGTARLKEFILETIKMRSINKDSNRFFDMMAAWKKNMEQTDDITMMGIEIVKIS